MKTVAILSIVGLACVTTSIDAAECPDKVNEYLGNETHFTACAEAVGKEALNVTSLPKEICDKTACQYIYGNLTEHTSTDESCTIDAGEGTMMSVKTDLLEPMEEVCPTWAGSGSGSDSSASGSTSTSGSGSDSGVTTSLAAGAALFAFGAALLC